MVSTEQPRECIGLGWLTGRFYRNYASLKTVKDVLVALRAAHRNKKGARGGAAKIIHSFVWDVQAGDIVVANRGYNGVVGIGVVKSNNYFSPRSPTNPMRGDVTTHRHHVREVEWLVDEEVHIPGDRFFVQATLSPLSSQKFGQVLALYLEQPALGPKSREGLGDLIDRVSPVPANTGNPIVPPPRVATTVCRIVRDTQIARLAKVLYDYECQDCGRTIDKLDGSRYAESHHIRPLGSPHNGPDILENILCLCPFCHAEYDLGVKQISPSLRLVRGHNIGDAYVDYHNTQVYRV